MPSEETLLSHALEGMCEDPDCELHNIQVAIQEGVVRSSDVAFWLAGYHAALDYVSKGLAEIRDETIAEGRQRTVGI